MHIESRRMRSAGSVAGIGEERKAYGVLVGNSEGKSPLGRPSSRWENLIRMALREIDYGAWGGGSFGSEQ